ncbi:MAG: CoA-binding protein [Candidatus Thorarchaeota archaeon]|nr:CoA-binding protein [Candidatus Thorarchaeota archaeon]
MKQKKRPTIEEMLKIQSVAIVGVSAKLGYYWVHSMLQWDHELRIWLVSKRGGEVMGHKIYTDLSEIPENIDYAIIAVPYKYVPQTLKECHEKGAKGVTIFTSGFSELGTDEGRQREIEVQNILDGLEMRAFGPNCMGLMFPELGFAFMPTVKRLAGDVGFLSQSGGVAIATYTSGVEAGVGFSKVFSFGNQVDIRPQELLDYLGDDTKTKAIGAYIEGAKNGREILEAMISAAKKKPLVVLKGGRSIEGSRAASSHTGALAGNREIWAAAFHQANVLTVNTLEDLIATLSIFSLSPQPKTEAVGLVAISGGTSVIYTDLCIESGLLVPPTSKETLERLEPLIRDVGTGLGNPIDLAADYYQDQTTSEVIQIVGEEPRFSSLIFEADVHNMHQVASIMDAQDSLVDYWRAMAKAGKYVVDKLKKPVLVAIPDIAYPIPRAEAWQVFVDAGLPVFRNISEAVNALARVCRYYKIKEQREK